jgi:hypothetical protein
MRLAGHESQEILARLGTPPQHHVPERKVEMPRCPRAYRVADRFDGFDDRRLLHEGFPRG